MLASLFLVLATLLGWAASKADDEETIRNAATVLQAMLSSKDIPPSALAKAHCVIILPSVKKPGGDLVEADAFGVPAPHAFDGLTLTIVEA